jgi:hypothetical protein
MSYDIIKYIHHLYLQYKNYISYTSFEFTAFGPDTLYNIYQTKNENYLILICKIIQIDNDYIYFPMKIITIFGIWSFIDEPNIIYKVNLLELKNQLINFRNELLSVLNLEFIFPAFIDEYNHLFHPMFIIKKFNQKILFKDDCEYKLTIDMDIYEYNSIESQLNKLYDIFFSKFHFGPDIINYKFDKFIESIAKLKFVDDKSNYFNDHFNLRYNKKQQNEYISNIKKYYTNKKKYRYQYNIYRMLFYYTYLNYFGKYKLLTLCDRFKMSLV